MLDSPKDDNMVILQIVLEQNLFIFFSLLEQSHENM